MTRVVVSDSVALVKSGLNEHKHTPFLLNGLLASLRYFEARARSDFYQ